MSVKVKFNIDKNFKEERAEFWLHKMTNKINSIAQELNNENDFVWCYRRGDMFPVKFSKIDLIQVENEKTYVYTEENVYLFKGRLYQINKLLPADFVAVSRSSVINYHRLDHLEILSNGNIDANLKNKMTVQVSRRKIRTLKERLGI
ncbi:LytTR family DNA-binding domain-containing protein [Lactobacillus johnsonii]|uniref:LytTR family DNA-binding domain-containing protein n=1 Tax=Lactobacillus johnsonii TaxID=33959 RepID=UPI000BA3A22D|nr:LytTR family DNA-binding domain-containing protein [Lactobacillus johnsonii]PAB50594.1 DNA-binding protein [Lactobacillus johnsonii]